MQSISLGSAARVAQFVNDSLADNSRRAYLSDLAQFEAWGGTIPASPEIVASYLADRADTLAVASVVRHVASISKAHEARGLPNPTRSELVRATLRGIRRTRGCAQREAKPLLLDDLLLVLDAMGEGLKDTRDQALLLVGFAGALRRSELVGLDVGDVEHVRQGIVLTLRRSKTDPRYTIRAGGASSASDRPFHASQSVFTFRHTRLTVFTGSMQPSESADKTAKKQRGRRFVADAPSSWGVVSSAPTEVDPITGTRGRSS